MIPPEVQSMFIEVSYVYVMFEVPSVCLMWLLLYRTRSSSDFAWTFMITLTIPNTLNIAIRSFKLLRGVPDLQLTTTKRDFEITDEIDLPTHVEYVLHHVILLLYLRSTVYHQCCLIRMDRERSLFVVWPYCIEAAVTSLLLAAGYVFFGTLQLPFLIVANLSLILIIILIVLMIYECFHGRRSQSPKSEQDPVIYNARYRLASAIPFFLVGIIGPSILTVHLVLCQIADPALYDIIYQSLHTWTLFTLQPYFVLLPCIPFLPTFRSSFLPCFRRSKDGHARICCLC